MSRLINLVKCVLSIFILISTLTFSTVEAHAQRRLCSDSEKNILVTRRKCKAPRFTEVAADSIIGGIELEVLNETTDLNLSNSGDSSGDTVLCPEGSLVTGGGVSIIDNDGLAIRRSIPRSSLTGWSGSVTAEKNGASGTLSIYAICATDAVAKEES